MLSPDNGDTSPLQVQSGRFAGTNKLSRPPAHRTTEKTREDMAHPLSLAMYSIILDAGKQEENEELSEMFYNNMDVML
jgi:hypothetical protein